MASGICSVAASVLGSSLEAWSPPAISVLEVVVDGSAGASVRECSEWFATVTLEEVFLGVLTLALVGCVIVGVVLIVGPSSMVRVLKTVPENALGVMSGLLSKSVMEYNTRACTAITSTTMQRYVQCFWCDTVGIVDLYVLRVQKVDKYLP